MTHLLLHANMLTEYFASFIAIVILLTGVIFFTSKLIKMYWRFKGKQQNIASNLPYYKDPVAFYICMILASILSFLIVISILVIVNEIKPSDAAFSEVTANQH